MHLMRAAEHTRQQGSDRNATQYEQDNTSGEACLGGLCFASTSWPCWSTSQKHTKCLRQCHIANVCQRGDHQSLFDTQVLVRVLEVDITNRNDDGVFVITPVEASLLEPLKVSGVLDLVLDKLLCRVKAQWYDYTKHHAGMTWARTERVCARSSSQSKLRICSEFSSIAVSTSD